MQIKYAFLALVFTSILFSCSRKITPQQSQANTAGSSDKNNVHAWLTEGNKSALFQQQDAIGFSDVKNQLPTIEVDSAQQFQEIDGFGFCLTDGSAQLINAMASTDKIKLLKELFSTEGNSIGISYIRVSIGASDLSSKVYSYDDLPAGQTDPDLSKFSIDENKIDLIPILKLILQINPQIKILGSPWSAPVWMKDNKSSVFCE
jgi:glucosylceramidase